MTTKRIRIFHLVLSILSFIHFVASFVPIVYSSKRFQRLLQYAAPPTDFSKEKKSAHRSSDILEERNNDEEKISEMDARVLKSMLKDGTIDVDTEEGMRKLLDRGVSSKTASQFRKKFVNETDSEFNSRMIQQLTDTKLWKAFSVKADDVLESFKLFAANRVERDSKLLAAIAFFVVERVKQDLVRALPVATSAGNAFSKGVQTTAFQLGNSSSLEDVQSAFKKGVEAVSTESKKEQRNLDDVNLYEEFNTPLDEIKSVTQSIRKILAGEASGVSAASSGRGLKSTAPAGQKSRTERQQRAYQKRKKTVLSREKESINVGRITSDIVDAAWEVKRDLETEANKPGYKTKQVRSAIAAGAEKTSRVIAAARDSEPRLLSNILFGSNSEVVDKEILTLEDASISQEEIPELPEIPPVPLFTIPEVPLPVEILDEQKSVVARLQNCIEMPAETWLTPDVLFDFEDPLDPDDMAEVVTTMICARDDLNVKAKTRSIEGLVKQLKQVKNTIDLVLSTADSKAGKNVTNNLSNILYGVDPDDDEILPTLLALEDIKENYLQEIKDTKIAAMEGYDAAVAERKRLLLERERISKMRERMLVEVKIAAEKAKEEQLAAEREETERKAANPIDVTFEKTTSSFSLSSAASSNSDVEVVLDGDMQGTAFTEVLTDDSDFDEANKFRTVTVDREEDEKEKEELNALLVFSLRSIDIFFVVGEKVLLVGLPSLFKVVGTASDRVYDVSKGGLGKVGWTRMTNTLKGSKRY